MKLANKVMVVTGGGNGLGREIARQLVERGASVAIVDLNSAALEETLRSLATSRAASFEGSVSDKSFVDELPRRVVERFGQVDGVINCAGVLHPFAPFWKLEWQAVERALGVNLNGTLFMVRAFLPHLLQRPEAHVLNVASMGGFVAVPGQSIYCASKAAVKLFTEGLRLELRKTNVGVSVVLPGALATNMLGNSGVALRAGPAPGSTPKGTSAAKAATRVLAGIEANTPQILVGPDAKIMSALSRLSPRLAAEAIFQQLGALLDE